MTDSAVVPTTPPLQCPICSETDFEDWDDLDMHVANCVESLHD